MIRRPPRSTLFPSRRSSDLTGLFDVLSKLPPSTSQQIADAASLNERYVREWLGGMVVGKVIEYDANKGTRSEEHTSELQSQSNLVCRLLLEKKKNKKSQKIK